MQSYMEKTPSSLIRDIGLAIFNAAKGLFSGKRYKCKDRVIRDLELPLQGLANCGNALFYLFIGLFHLISTLVKGSLNLERSGKDFFIFIGLSILGLIQMSTTPLVWIGMIVLRGPLTLLFGWRKFDENTSTQQLIAKGRELISHNPDKSLSTEEINQKINALQQTITKLESKKNKAKRIGQVIVNEDELEKAFSKFKEQRINRFNLPQKQPEDSSEYLYHYQTAADSLFHAITPGSNW